MKLSPIALLSLLSVIPLAANDHDVIESRVNDLVTVHDDEVKASLDGIHDSSKDSNAVEQIMEDAENDAADPLAPAKQAQHEQIDNAQNGDEVSPNVEGEVEGNMNGKDDEGSSRNTEKPSGEPLDDKPAVIEDAKAEEVTSGTNSESNETIDAEGKDHDSEIESTTTGVENIDGIESANESKTSKEEERGKPVEIDYANKSTGALILDKSKNFQGTSNLLVADKDKYSMIPCDQGDQVKFVIVGLSEDILVKSIKLSSYEKYSSLTKRFQVLGSQTYPVMSEWEDLGTFDAKPWYKENKQQTFEIAQPSWARYLKFRFLDHYGDEHYCAYTQIKVLGSTTLQGYHEMQLEETEAAEAEEAAQAVIDEIESAKSTQSMELDSKTGARDVVEAVVDSKLSDFNSEVLKEGDEERIEEETTAAPESTDNDDPTDEVEGDNVNNNSSVVVSEQDLPSENNSDSTQIVADVDAGSAAVEGRNDGTENHSNEKVDQNANADEISIHEKADLVDEVTPKKAINETGKNAVEKEDDESPESPEPVEVPDAHVIEHVEESTQPTSSSVVTSAVHSAIKSVKTATLMKDAVKEGINQIMKSKASVQSDADEATDKIAQENMQEQIAENKNEAVSDGYNPELNPAIKNSSGLIPIQDVSSTIDPKKSSAESEPELSVIPESINLNVSTTTSSNSASANANNDTASREALKAAEEMLFLLSKQFPSAKCLDYLDFSEFKKRTIEAANQKSSTQGEKSKLPASKNEPIFKKLTDEIKILQASQGVYEQYIKSATSCYQRVIIDLGHDLATKQKEQEERMRILESQMREFVENQQTKRMSVKDLLVTVKVVVVEIVAKTFPMIFSWYSYLKITALWIAERLLGNEYVQRLISFVVAYERDAKTFLFGVLCCYAYVRKTKLAQQVNVENRKEHKRRRRPLPKSAFMEDAPLIIVKSVPTLRTDGEESQN